MEELDEDIFTDGEKDFLKISEILNIKAVSHFGEFPFSLPIEISCSNCIKITTSIKNQENEVEKTKSQVSAAQKENEELKQKLLMMEGKVAMKRRTCTNLKKRCKVLSQEVLKLKQHLVRAPKENVSAEQTCHQTQCAVSTQNMYQVPPPPINSVNVHPHPPPNIQCTLGNNFTQQQGQICNKTAITQQQRKSITQRSQCTCFECCHSLVVAPHLPGNHQLPDQIYQSSHSNNNTTSIVAIPPSQLTPPHDPNLIQVHGVYHQRSQLVCHCGVTFSSQQCLWGHLQQAQASNGQLLCTICQLNFQNMGRFRDHVMECHAAYCTEILIKIGCCCKSCEFIKKYAHILT